MYQNIFITKRTENEPSLVYIWDDTTGLKIHNWKKFNYAFKRDPNGKFTSIYGDQLKKVISYSYDDPTLFESDLPRETRVLTDLYLEDDTPSKNHRILIFDIEVDSKGGFATVEKADKQITAISAHNSIEDKYYAWLLDIDDRFNIHIKIDNTTVFTFKNEAEMLSHFMLWYRDFSPTIITGWNTNGYDIPYLYHRLINLFDVDSANMLSPIGIVRYSDLRESYQIAGVSNLDYLPLYRKFTYTQRPNYQLNTVAQFEIQRSKLSYEGSLDELYAKDIETYIKYNVNDTVLVCEIDKKLKFIELVQSISHLGHTQYEDYIYSSKYIEGTILTYLHRKNIICANKPIGGKEEFAKKLSSNEEGFDGAFVKPPMPGLYEWVYGLDLQSLYPSIIMSLNISTETKVGSVLNWNSELHIQKKITEYKVQINKQDFLYTSQKFEEFMNVFKLSISSNGILYRQDKLGVIPEILTEWFAKRKQYKDLSAKYKREVNEEQAEFYDRLQYTFKIFLNSVYGYLGLPIARFYDLDNAEAVTSTGQDIIKATSKYISKIYETRGAIPRSDAWLKEYKIILIEAIKEKQLVPEEITELLNPHNHCLYIDTDSVYFSGMSLLNNLNNNDEYIVQELVSCAKEMEKKCNVFYDILLPKMFFCPSHKIIIKGEVVAKTAFWVKKKRYALDKIYDLEKDMLIDVNDPEKIKIKGLDIVRSTFPSAFQTFMKELLIDILNKKDKISIDEKILEFKQTLPFKDFKTIIANIAVKELSKFENQQETNLSIFPKGAPAQSKAAITYNRMLYRLGLEKQYEPIRDGMKIKWAYLKQNPYDIPTIAIKTYNDPPEILDLIKTYINYDAIFDSQLTNKLQVFYDTMGWGKIPTEVNQRTAQFFEFV
jgi:DNA polymerase elongation subunit (family B)